MSWTQIDYKEQEMSQQIVSKAFMVEESVEEQLIKHGGNGHEAKPAVNDVQKLSLKKKKSSDNS